jgi:hypothetical protein
MAAAISSVREAPGADLLLGGITIDEVAEVTAVSAATMVREWTVVKAWLRAELMS